MEVSEMSFALMLAMMFKGRPEPWILEGDLVSEAQQIFFLALFLGADYGCSSTGGFQLVFKLTLGHS
jgi:hypothetical protein